MHLVYWLITGIFFLAVAGWVGYFVPYKPDTRAATPPAGLQTHQSPAGAPAATPAASGQAPQSPAAAQATTPMRGGVLGILIDNRGRFSLTNFQVVIWSLVLLSLLAAVFIDRLLNGGLAGLPTAMNITVPTSLLVLAGISGGSAVIATAVKAAKFGKVDLNTSPQFRQIFMAEEGDNTDQTIDVTKFQGFFFTVIAVIAYIALASSQLASAKAPLDSLPDIGQGVTWLIGISHAAYLGAKIPDKE
jgi:hypothetical protein